MNSTRKQVLLWSFFFKWRYWVQRMLSNLPKTTQLGSRLSECVRACVCHWHHHQGPEHIGPVRNLNRCGNVYFTFYFQPRTSPLSSWCLPRTSVFV
jgi:hypothetical protein